MRLARTSDAEDRPETVKVFYPSLVRIGHQEQIFAVVPRRPRDFGVEELQDFHAATNGFVELHGCAEGTKFSRPVIPQSLSLESDAYRLGDAITKHLRFKTKPEPVD